MTAGVGAASSAPPVVRAAIARRTSRSSPMRALRRTSSRRPRSRAAVSPFSTSAPESVQGDVAFVDVLGRMGATVEQGVRLDHRPAAAPLAGVAADLSDLSDTAPTLAVVAPFASSSTEVRGIGFIRSKESDRIAAVVSELHRCRRRRGRATGRLRRASRGATRSDDRDVRRPPHGDELRVARSRDARRRDPRS